MSDNLKVAYSTKPTIKTKLKSAMRVKLFSYDARLIAEAMDELKNVLHGTGITICGPIPIPTRIKTFTVLRSPHVDKKSREHFEIRTHVRVLFLINCTNNIVDLLSRVVLPSGVEIKIRYQDNNA